MKTTVEIPDALYARARAAALAQGISFRRLLVGLLEQNLYASANRPWMSSFGAMAAEQEAIYEVDRVVQRDLETIDPGEWA